MPCFEFQTRTSECTKVLWSHYFFADYSIPKAASSDAEVSLVQKVSLFEWRSLDRYIHVCILHCHSFFMSYQDQYGAKDYSKVLSLKLDHNSRPLWIVSSCV